MDTLDYSALPEEIKFCFMCMMQAALRMRMEEMSGEMFMDMAQGIWETVEMNDLDDLTVTLNHIMRKEMRERVSDLPSDFFEETGLKR